MAGQSIPFDRTTKQPVRAYCLNPECRESSDDQRYEFDAPHDKFCCPKCGADGPLMVGLLTLIHLLVSDRKGPVVGSEGRRYRLACSATRAHLATTTNNEAATGYVPAVNCPACLRAAHDAKLANQGIAIHPR
jgi:hypothetical protein